ncbi:MAG TPA: response regulator transcription factor, partial [Bacteroidia bacterium]|nr:response regulator transcription factor [Bacteroidia bacterium]
MNKIKVYLVDDHKIFVEGVANLLSDQSDLTIMGWTYDGNSVLQFLKENSVDLILTDIQMPGMTGIELTQKIKEAFPYIKVIALSMFDKKEIVQKLISSGAEGYLLKDIEKSELLNAIRKVASGEYYYSSSIASILMKSITEKDLLTKREKEIIKLIAEENTNSLIAEKLFISEHTVESHRKNIFRKTNAKSI